MQSSEIPTYNQKLGHTAFSRSSHTGREKFATDPAACSTPLERVIPSRAWYKSVCEISTNNGSDEKTSYLSDAKIKNNISLQETRDRLICSIVEKNLVIFICMNMVAPR